jgi:hypothetical protein
MIVPDPECAYGAAVRDRCARGSRQMEPELGPWRWFLSPAWYDGRTLDIECYM